MLAAPAATVILLDLDGTLAPIVPRPSDVAVPPSIIKLIRRLAHSYLAVAIVSGRSATEAKRIIGNAELAYIGNHGFETMLPGHATVVCEEAQPFMASMKEITGVAPQERLSETGVWLENKISTISLHYRRAADPDAALDYIRGNILPRAEQLGLDISEGRMVIEIKPPVDINKGVSVGRLLDLLSAKQAIYIGDDTTDIDALRELRKRRRRKDTVMVGIGVISREMPSSLPKSCDLLVERTTGVETVLEILAGDDP